MSCFTFLRGWFKRHLAIKYFLARVLLPVLREFN